MRTTMRPTVWEDIPALLRDVREEDRREWEDGVGFPLEEQLHGVLLCPTTSSWTITEDRPGAPPLAIWGVDGVERSPVGNVWLIATNAAMRRTHSLHRMVGQAMATLDGLFPKTQAVADTRNVAHHGWLRWLGWEPTDSLLCGPKRLPFTRYERTARQCASPPPL